MSRSAPPAVIPIRPLPAGADDGAMVSMDEKQAKIYPRAVSGWSARWRWTMVWLTQIVFYGLPWLPWSGRQAVLFDLGERRFFVFGLALQPQDLIYLAALLLIAAPALFFCSAGAGRLWCGYACPRTVYTEMFLWVERRIEGDRLARIRPDAAPWGAGKLARKGARQLVWLGIGLVTGFTFVGYFTPIRTLAADLAALSLSPAEAFWVLLYGLGLLAVSAAVVLGLSLRSRFTVDAIKDRGTLARRVEDGRIENVCTLHIANGTEQPRPHRVRVSGLPDLRIATPTRLELPASGIGSLPVRLSLAPEAAEPLRGRASSIVFEVVMEGEGEPTTRRETSTFLLPR